MTNESHQALVRVVVTIYQHVLGFFPIIFQNLAYNAWLNSVVTQTMEKKTSTQGHKACILKTEFTKNFTAH